MTMSPDPPPATRPRRGERNDRSSPHMGAEVRALARVFALASLQVRYSSFCVQKFFMMEAK